MKPYAAMVLLQFGYASTTVAAAATLKQGMNHFVLVVYRNAVAAAVLAPFAFCFERKTKAKLTRATFLKIVGIAIMEPVIDQNFCYVGTKMTSASFASSFYNILPAVTFIMALLLRMEKLNLRKRHSQAKVAGAAVTAAGAFLMIVYKGPVVNFLWSMRRAHEDSQGVGVDHEEGTNLLGGALMLFISTMAWSSFLILQSKTLESYPAELSLSVWICCMGVMLNAIIALVVEHGSLQPWSIGWDMRLFTVVFTGIICSGVSYYVQGMVMKKRGPVFVTAFNPLSMIMTSVMGHIILSEEITLGRIFGAICIVAGLYSLVWGKSNEHQRSMNEGAATNKGEPELPIVGSKQVITGELVNE
ncbi:WAT1-related protein [Platanthera zijinensis]|uniref:WAT1-related protein n=1 Tax=Platanthera zijinensis TaxID=2320716 RepID=A0AAP0GC93_9ASPA